MKKNRSFPLLFISVLFTACQEPSNTPAPSMATPLPATAVSATNPPGDPNFVETKDTVSAHGPKSITRNILQDLNGHYWLATWEGLIWYDGKQYTNFTLKAGLKKYHVFAITEQRNGTLWFGMIGGGVYRYDGQTFTQFTTANGLVNNVVECIVEDNAGNIWFGTENGISRYDGYSFTNFTTKEGLCNDHINAIIEDKMGTLWFATRGGLCTYDGQFFTNISNEKGTNFSHVTSIMEDRAGKIWVGSQDGLCRMDGNNKTSISKESIGSIFEDKKGDIWLAVSQREKMVLSRYDGKSVTEVKSDIQVFGITGDKAGNIWYGTTHGAVRF